MRKCSICKIDKELSEFHRKGKGYQHICKECRKQYIRDHYKNNKGRYLEMVKDRKRKNANEINELKKTFECNRCGEDDITCLDFHHQNPEEKELSVSLAINQGWSVGRIKKEIDKCVVLCSNCHRKLHYKLRLGS